MSWLKNKINRSTKKSTTGNVLDIVTTQNLEGAAGKYLDMSVGGSTSKELMGSDLRNVLGKDVTNVLDYLNPITLVRPEPKIGDEAPEPTNAVAAKPDLLFRRRASRANSGFRSLMIPLSGSARSQTGLGIPT
jgi:hypothetical protein